VVVLSGFLVEEECLGVGASALGDTPIFWAHGVQDPAVPFSLALSGWERINQAGGRLEVHHYPIGHWVAPEEISELRNWLRESISSWEG
jgi:phospholipase/carboxylesterase